MRLCAELHPDVVLMDLRMPGMDGLTAIEHLHVEQPEIAVVILTTFNEDDLMMRGLRAGPRATCSRTPTGRRCSIPSGQPRVARPCSSRRSWPGCCRRPARPACRRLRQADLTGRELEVLQAVAQGERSKEIAVRLGISERTVKAHLASIYNKLGVDSAAPPPLPWRPSEGWLASPPG